MRPDMPRIVHQTYSKKYASSKENPLRKIHDIEEMPAKESMGLKFRKDKKQKGLKTSPFYRWLHKQVGRPWDKVWHEVCAVEAVEHKKIPSVDSHWHFGEGLRDMVDWWVERHVLRMEGNVPYDYRFGRYGPIISKLYVHPVSGLLCEYIPDKIQPKVEPLTFKVITESILKPVPLEEKHKSEDNKVTIQRGVVKISEKAVYANPVDRVAYRIALRKIKGLWYETDEYEVIPSQWLRRDHKGNTYHVPFWAKNAAVILKKRQLNTKELKKFGFK
jgi:hypothetical protein